MINQRGGRFKALISNHLPSSITHLTFEFHYNHISDHLPSSITHLTFGYLYNQPNNDLPSSITHLTFGYGYNQPIIFPTHLKNLIFNSKIERYVDDLYDLYELTHTSILAPRMMNHVEKNKHNLKMKSLMFLDSCL